MNKQTEKIWNIFFYLFILFYFFIIFYKGNFGLIDDHTFMSTLFLGKMISFLYLKIIGRFFPLCGFEWNIISFFSTSPFAFYLYNSFQFLIVFFLLYKIFNDITRNKKLIYIFILLFILNPGFVTSWLRFFCTERNSVFFFTIFLYFYLKFQNKQNFLFMIIAFVSANIALYYKETSFLILGTFSFFHLILGWKNLNIKQKIFDFLLLISSLIFIIVYYFVVYLHRGETLYGESSHSFFYYFSLIISYILNNPLLFLNIAFFLWRCFSFFKKKIKLDLLYDSMSLSAIVYCLAFLKLGIYNTYYLLPAYVFAMPALIFYFSNINWREKIFLKIASIATLLLVVFNSLPSGIYWFSFYKNIPHNYQKTLDFLDSYINKNFEKKNKTNIFLYGIYRNSGNEIYYSFTEFLEKYKKLPSNSFDLKTNLKVEYGYLDENSSYSYLQKYEPDEIEKNDLLIVTPYTYKNFYKDSFDDYEIIFRTHSLITIPDLGLRSILKYNIASYFDKKSLNTGKYSSKFFGLPQDFYILKKIN